MSTDSDSPKDDWAQELERSPMRDAEFTTMSGLEVHPTYGPSDRSEEDSPGDYPGQYPYTRGPYASMYRTKLWTMRMFAGFGSPESTNTRFKDLLKAGGDGLSVAYDLPTLMGRDSDDPMAYGEVGRCGVAVDTIEDMATLFEGIDVAATTTSMTINSPAAPIFAMFIAAAEASGTARSELGGTLQNDILKEYQAQKEFLYPPRPSMRIVEDSIRFCEAEMPSWHPVSVSGYHIREAGSTAAEELAFTLANGFAYVELGLHGGLDVDSFGGQLSFFFNAHIDFFEEIAKYRAARRIWANWMSQRYGAKSEKAQMLRFHTQTAGVSLTAQQPEVNIVRTAVEALAAVMGGTQSLHTNSYDETLALPSDKAARVALRTQQVIARESRVANVSDPLGGSWYVESLTDQIEEEALELLSQVDAFGDGSMLEGCIQGIEDGWFQGRIAESAYDLERRLNDGKYQVVGVNCHTEGNEEAPPETLYIDQSMEDAQAKCTRDIKATRSASEVEAALTRLRDDAGDSTVNLMPAFIDAANAHASLGEMCSTLGEVFGWWEETPAI